MKKGKVVPIRYPWAMSYCCMTLIKGEKNILIDTAFEKSIPFLQAELEKEDLSLNEIDFVINTHTHGDHIEGNAKILQESGASLYLHPAGKEILQLQGADYPMNTFKDEELFFSNRIFFTPGHAKDCICILEEESKTLIIGDSIEGNGNAFAGLALIHDVVSYMDSVRKMQFLCEKGGIQRIIFSHYTDNCGDEVNGKENVEKFLSSSLQTAENYISFTEKMLEKDPEISPEKIAEGLRKNYGVSPSVVSPGTACGVAKAFVEYCRKRKKGIF